MIFTLLLWTMGPIGAVFFFRMKEDASDQKNPAENADASLLCKFVLDGFGKKIGESVSVDHDVLIIKSGSQFLGVPLKHVETADKTLVVKGLIDFTKAYELGEKWRKDSYRELKQHDHPESKR